MSRLWPAAEPSGTWLRQEFKTGSEIWSQLAAEVDGYGFLLIWSIFLFQEAIKAQVEEKRRLKQLEKEKMLEEDRKAEDLFF